MLPLLAQSLDLALNASAGAVGLLAGWFALEALLGSVEPPPPGNPGRRPDGVKVGVLVPAHNEAAQIAQTIRSVLDQLDPSDALLVVADNCTDNTADIARAMGAEVVERHDTERRGKGFALDFGLQHLFQREGITHVVMIDADCLLAPKAMTHLIAACVQSGQPTQARYLMQAPQDSGLKVRVAEFAWLVKNQIRPLGMHRLGLPCHLTGSGMAFPISVLRDVPLASGNLVEDMQLGLDLAQRGHAPRYCHESLVTSTFAPTDAGLQSQRQRWEHGHLQTIATQVPALLRCALQRRDPRLALLALDLGIPPLASLVILTGLVAMVSALWCAWNGAWTALLLAGVAQGMLLVGVLTAWGTQGRKALSARELVAIFPYLIQKLPLYRSFFAKRQVSWVRTAREEHGEP